MPKRLPIASGGYAGVQLVRSATESSPVLQQPGKVPLFP
jgi:hypothetical protein